jgi:starch synthase (maltosyl-transferring)
MTKAKRGKTPATAASNGFDRLVVECVTPELDGGRYPVKRIIGDVCEIGADVLKDGHDLLAGHVRYRVPDDDGWRFTPLAYDRDADRWTATLPLDRIGRWEFSVEGWTDLFGTWRSELEKKVAAGHDVRSELIEGAALIRDAARRSKVGEGSTTLETAAATLADETVGQPTRARAALDPALLELVEKHFVPHDLTTYPRVLSITVDRERAGFAAWYEMFPRSQASDPKRHGTFADAEKALPRIAELGFDVVYLPPIHPIGTTYRKGPNNSLQSGPSDVGSPWAIGSAHGGHTAVEPRLGTIDDFVHFVQTARSLGMEVALDYALQCSPDHPWVKEHPDWFFIRPDGTIKYAENPPKKYQDIYPLNFWCEDRQGLWDACRDIFLFWMEHGVRTFRVDNPHTKPFAFWERVIGEIRRDHPDVIFLSEAFTRPKRMNNLAKLGFTQSYTYFTWKNSAWELEEYLTELTQSPMVEYFRGNLFVNTPDILHEYLQEGGPGAFRIRLLLAATLLPLYGVYSGYELFENVPLRKGSEEYLNSEKYQLRVRDWAQQPNLDAEIRLLNRIRRERAALRRYENLRFHTSENREILFYSKLDERGGDDRDDLLIAVTTDPRRPHETMVHVPVHLLGIPETIPYVVEDLLTGTKYTWRGVRNYVRLDPSVQPGHVLRVIR